MKEGLQESRMRENRKSGSTRGRAGGRNSHLFLSTLLVSAQFIPLLADEIDFDYGARIVNSRFRCSERGQMGIPNFVRVEGRIPGGYD
jgi:hypothetical protein